MYNPLLDMEIPTAAPWQAVSERVHSYIERAARKSNTTEAFKWLNVLDLLDTEAAAYWREQGLALYARKGS